MPATEVVGSDKKGARLTGKLRNRFTQDETDAGSRAGACLRFDAKQAWLDVCFVSNGPGVGIRQEATYATRN